MKRAILIVSFLVLAGAAIVWIGLPGRAKVRALRTKNPTETSVMRQRDREAAAAGRRSRRSQTWIPLSRISRSLIEGVVAAEDAKFFGHQGFDWESLRESAEKNWQKRGFVRGGSTITQQLAKNLFFTTRKDPLRKAREFVVAWWLEEDLSKRRILEIYLNVIEWGDGVYGCEAAARRYYGKSAANLTSEEAAGLAAMIPNPRRINPAVNPRWHARATRRVLWLMGLAGRIRRGEDPPTTATPPPVPPPDDAVDTELTPEPLPAEIPVEPLPAEVPVEGAPTPPTDATAPAVETPAAPSPPVESVVPSPAPERTPLTPEPTPPARVPSPAVDPRH